MIIPTYNRLPYILEAVQSVLAQTYPHWELIVVDDGSADNTIKEIRLINDPRISVIASAHLGHIGRLRNIGVKAGRGKWLAFLDSDDVWMPGKLALQLRAMEENGTRWSYGRFELMDESGKPIPEKAGKYFPLSGRIIRQLLTHKASVTICSVLVERTLFEEVGGFNNDPRLLYRGDYELELRLALNAEVTGLPDLIVKVREHRGRVTSTLNDPYVRSALPYTFFLQLKPGMELEKIARRRRGYLFTESAKANIAIGKYRLALRHISRAIKDRDQIRHILSGLYKGIKIRLGPKRQNS